MDSVGLFENSQCVDCLNINGIKCYGFTNIIVSHNYWISPKEASNSIISNFCPSGYCCQEINGCNYSMAVINDGAGLCAYGRNPDTPLCGQCLSGYSEVFGSSTCKKCESNNYSLLIVPIIIAFVFVLVFVILDYPPKQITDDNGEVNYIWQLLKDDLKGIELMIFRPIVYFYQVLNITLFEINDICNLKYNGNDKTINRHLIL